MTLFSSQWMADMVELYTRKFRETSNIVRHPASVFRREALKRSRKLYSNTILPGSVNDSNPLWDESINEERLGKFFEEENAVSKDLDTLLKEIAAIDLDVERSRTQIVQAKSESIFLFDLLDQDMEELCGKSS